MKNNSRRIFLRDASLVTSGVLVMSPLAASNKSGSSEAISCGPASIKGLTGTLGSVKSGKWSDPSTWGGQLPGAGDTPVISTSHTVDVDVNTTVAGVNVNAGGILQFDNSRSSELKSTRNIVVQGKLVMKPSSAGVLQKIVFVGVNESAFTGGGHDVIEGDVGLWVMGSGQLDLAGARKKPWTRTIGSVRAGANSFTTQDSSGWEIGDEIVLVPTDIPGEYAFQWPRSAPKPTDSFAAKFERRLITAKSGNTITVNSPFTYDHNQVSTDTGKTWTPEVANLSRNVRIEGTEEGRTHIFIRSTMPQNIYYIGGRHLGPRKQGNRRATDLVTGRYGLHFHHCNDGSKGSMVEGCALYDAGNRLYVPHTSHGVTMRNNVAFNCMEASFWWDFQELSHFVTWDGNLTALVSQNGNDSSSRGMEMNQGDGNVARNNVVVYGHNGGKHHQGAYVWNADTEGVWVFENNLSHSNRTGIFVWQNTPNNHTIVNHESYNDEMGVFHGAYINSYTYTNCYFYNSLVLVKATSGNASGVRFEKSVFDGGNIREYVTEIFPSPVTSGADYNAFRECTFKNYSAVALRMNTFPLTDRDTRKHVCLIKCNVSGKVLDFTKESASDSKLYVQPASGPVTCISQQGTTTCAAFAPYLYGTGRGLKGDYYNGSNFANHAFTRNDSMIMFQEWLVDMKTSPTGVHHLLKSDNYSVRWTGKVEAQYTEPYKFTVQGSGGFRLWVNNVQLINSWMDRPKATDSIVSPTINLVAGEKYDIKFEHMNTDGKRSCQLFWECPSIGRTIHIPQSQLYSDLATSPPPPPVISQNPIANAGADITITLPVTKALLDGSATVPKANIKKYEWSKVSGPGTVNIISSNAATTEVKDLVEGTYVFRLLVTGSTGTATTDEVTVKVNKTNESGVQPFVANAGTDITIELPTSVALLDGSASSPKESISSCEWTKVSGPAKGDIANKTALSTNVQNLTEGTYEFKLQITDKNGKASVDDVRVYVKPQPPVAKAGSDVSVAVTENSVVLNGSASFAPLGIRLYEWSKVSGPNSCKIVNKNAISPVIKELEKGTYVFRLQITDKKGTTAVDEVTVTVGSGGTNNSANNRSEKQTKEKIILRIHPSANPSSRGTDTVLKITSNGTLPIRVTIYNRWGKMEATYPNLQNNSTIRWGAGSQQGTYYVVAQQGDIVRREQLVKL